jgi:hypothetical protein
MIYVIGDSFTWGDELSDFIVPGWPGFKDTVISGSRAEIDWLENRHTYFINSSEEVRKEHELLRLSNRWPSILQKKLNVEVINSGLCGKSTAGMVTRAVSDLTKIVNENKKVSLIIVQLTAISRYQIPCISDDYDYSGWYQHGYFQVNQALDDYNKRTLPEKLYKFNEYKTIMDRDPDIVYEFLNNISKLQLIAKLATNKKLVIVDSMFRDSNSGVITIANNETFTKQHTSAGKLYFNLLSETNIVNEMNRYPSMSDIVNMDSKCKIALGGHVCMETHRIFGELIAQRIIEDGLL